MYLLLKMVVFHMLCWFTGGYSPKNYGSGKGILFFLKTNYPQFLFECVMSAYVKIVVELVLSTKNSWCSDLQSPKVTPWILSNINISIYIYTACVFYSCHPLQGHHNSGWVFQLTYFLIFTLILGVHDPISRLHIFQRG